MKSTVKLIILYTVITIGLFSIGYSRNFDESYAMNEQYVEAENLALNKTYTSNSGVAKNMAFDGKNHTFWQALSREDVYIQVDLGEAAAFDTIVLKEKGLDIQKFKIQVSNDGDNFEDIYIQDKIEKHRLVTFDIVEARYVRLLIEEADRLPGIKELEIYNAGKVQREEDFKVTAYISLGHVYEKLEDDNLSQEDLEEIFQAQYFDTVTDVFFIFDTQWDESGNIMYTEGWDENGRLILSNDGEKFSNALSKFREAIGDRDVNIFVTIFNPHDNGEVVTSITTNREALISNMVDFANKHQLDGIDLDWEFPFSQDEYDAYNSFLQELKGRLVSDVKPDMQLSLALATWALRYTPETIAVIDQVQVMGYDILDQDGHHSSFYGAAVQPMQYLLDQGFSKEQLNLGYPFYGTYLEGRMEQYMYNRLEQSQFNQWDNTQTIEGVGSVYFNGPAMLKDKTAYALYNGFGGVMIFSLYCDTPYEEEHSLVRAISETLEERMEVQEDEE